MEEEKDKEIKEREEQLEKKEEDKEIEDIETLKTRLQEKEEEIKRLQEKLLYLQADFENFKKLKMKEKEDLLRFGNEILIKELLPVIDNLEMALDQASKVNDVEGIKEGIRLTLNEFLRVLKKAGVTPIEALGKKFDPLFHEALCEELRDDLESGTVVCEFKKGYLLNGRVIRPSCVSVSKKSEMAQ